MSNHLSLLSSTDSKTQKKNTCAHCQSGIRTLDKTCSQCGAPNESYDDKVDNNYSCDFYDSSWFK